MKKKLFSADKKKHIIEIRLRSMLLTCVIEITCQNQYAASSGLYNSYEC